MPRCADCGFLSAFSYVTNQHVEPSDEVRATGQPAIENFYGANKEQPYPICFAGKADLRADLDKMQPTNPNVHRRKHCVQLVEQERDCDGFMKRIRDCSPKEHRDMLQREADLRFQDEMRERAKASEAAQREKDRQWQEERRKEDLARQQAQRRWDKAWALFMVIFAAGLGLVTLAVGYWLGLKK